MTLIHHSEISRRRFLQHSAAALAGLALGGKFLSRPTAANASAPSPVPPSLMLHPREKDIAQLPRLLKWLSDEQYTTIHYADLARAMRGDAALPERAVLLTIDDLGSHFVEPEFYTMVDLIENAGHRASFGVVTRDTPARSPRVWDVLREFAARGFEMNTHTSTHSVLSDLETLDELRDEIVGSANMLADGLGSRPASLIAPYGDVYVPNRFRVLDQRIFEIGQEAGLDFVVGIVGGREITADARAPYYVGRVGVGVDAYQTRWWLENFAAM